MGATFARLISQVRILAVRLLFNQSLTISRHMMPMLLTVLSHTLHPNSRIMIKLVGYFPVLRMQTSDTQPFEMLI